VVNANIDGFKELAVEHVFDRYEEPVRTKLLVLRELIFNTAQELEEVGQLQETLKWGQPSYLTYKPKTGSTIRIDAIKKKSNQYALYVNCQTSLIETFKQMYPQKFNFLGKRALIFDVKGQLPEKELSHCIALALTYHLNKL